MKFPYPALRTARPIHSLGGRHIRYRPIIPIQIRGPGSLRHLEASVDSGSDDTLFPAYVAQHLGINLQGAPEGEAHPIGPKPVPYRYATVQLRLSDGNEAYKWDAMVGFIEVPLRWPILGHAGCLEFFDIELRGHDHAVIFSPNSSFLGQRTERQSPRK